MEINLPPVEKIHNPTFVPYSQSKHRYRIFWGGRGSSKSTFVARDKIIKCLTQPYFRGIITRKIYADIKDSIYDTIKSEIIAGGLESLFTFRASPLEIECINGNKFIARGFDRADKTKSIKDPTDVIYEEANEITKEDFITTSSSLSTTKAPCIQEDLMLNPEISVDLEDYWLYDMFFKGNKGKSFEGAIEVQTPVGKIISDYLVHHSTYKDNLPNLKPEFIAFLENLREYDPYYYDVYCLGEWGQKKVERPFATAYKKEKHEGPVVYQPGQKVFMSIDFNVDPFGAIFYHIFRDSDGEHCHVFDEIEIFGGNISEMAQQIKTRFYNDIPTIEITGDAMGKNRKIGLSDNNSLFTDLKLALGIRERQINVPSNPTHKESRTNLNYFLYHFYDFKINPDTCPNTARDMKTVQCDAFGAIIKRNRKDINQRADHFDCIRYLENTHFYDWRKKHQRGFYKKGAK